MCQCCVLITKITVTRKILQFSTEMAEIRLDNANGAESALKPPEKWVAEYWPDFTDKSEKF